MSTILEQIVAAMVTELNTGTPVGVPTAQRSRHKEIKPAEEPGGAISVYPLRNQPVEVGGRWGPLTAARATILIDCTAIGTALVRPDQAVDPLRAWVVKKLAGNTYGGLAHDTEESDTTFEYEHGDAPICRAGVEMIVSYQHLTADAEMRS